MSVKEGPEGRGLLLASLDCPEDHFVVVGEVGVGLQLGAELDEHIT